MKKSGSISRSLKMMLPLTLASLGGCADQSLCAVRPRSDGCAQLGAGTGLDDAPLIPRSDRSDSSVKFSLLNLDPQGQNLPNANWISPRTDATPALPVARMEELAGLDGGVVVINPMNSAELLVGPGNVCFELFSPNDPSLLLSSVSVPAFVYTPPRFDVATALAMPQSYAAPYSALEVTILPVPAEAPASGLFITEQDDNLSQRSLHKYNYDKAGGRLVADADFGPPIIAESPGQYRGLFALTATTAFAYQYSPFATAGYYLTPYRISPYMKGSAMLVSDRDMSRKIATILAADPVSATRMIVDAEQIDVFNFDSGASYKRVASVSTPTPLRYLSAYKYAPPADDTSATAFDAVAVDKTNQIQIYQLNGGSLGLATELSAAVNAAAKRDEKNGLSTSTVVGLAVADIDADGYFDIVLALQPAAPTEPTQLGWIRYEGHGRFGTLDQTTRANLAGSALTNVHSLAVGDLNGDGKPDAALAADGVVQVYINQSL